MKKISLAVWIFIALILLVIGFGIYKFNFTNDDIYLNNSKQIGTIENNKFNFTDGTYTINGQKITLKNGVSKIEGAPGSASKIITQYFGNEVKHDFDGDGREDIAFILTQETGGSGIFYYVVVLLNTTNGPIGSNGILLGDRIAPQTTQIDEKSGRVNVIVVNYADRNPGEPMTTIPSLGKSIWLKLDQKTMQIGEVAQNFEGEADPAKMNLNMKTWNWVNTVYNDGKLIKPLSDNRFTITFKSDKTFSATTDCNTVGGEYSVNKNQISFSRMVSTLMYCENSQENDFTKMLENVTSYFFTSKGELIIELKYDSGSIILR